MLRLPTNSEATTRAAKCVLSSDSTRTSAPGRPSRINSAISCGLMGGEFSRRGIGRAFALGLPSMLATHAASDAQLLASARRALGIEARAVEALRPRLDERFVAACRICLACEG